MQNNRLKSRTFRRVKRKVPGNRVVIHYVKRKNQPARCAICGAPLKGVPRDNKKLSKSEKRPERPYGGMLCSKCMRELMIKKSFEINESLANKE